METAEKGQRGFDRVDDGPSRGGAAFVLGGRLEGDQIVLRHGPRIMPVLHTHLIPATFGVRAGDERRERAGGAARRGHRRPPPRHPAGPADLHDLVLPGAGTASNYLESRRSVGSTTASNVDGMRNLADFASRWPTTMARTVRPQVGARSASSGCRATGATRTCAVHNALAAGAFDEIIVREDRNLRGRSPGATATLVADGVRSAKEKGTGRTIRVDKVLDELMAVKTAAAREPGRPRGDVRGRLDRRLPRGHGICRQTRRRYGLRRPRRSLRAGGAGGPVPALAPPSRWRRGAPARRGRRPP